MGKKYRVKGSTICTALELLLQAVNPVGEDTDNIPQSWTRRQSLHLSLAQCQMTRSTKPDLIYILFIINPMCFPLPWHCCSIIVPGVAYTMLCLILTTTP